MHVSGNHINNSKPTLLSFHADWCGTCQTMTPIIAELLDKIGNKINFLEIDIDKNPQIAAAFRVRSIPYLILFNNGKSIWRHSGLIPAKEIIASIKID